MAKITLAGPHDAIVNVGGLQETLQEVMEGIEQFVGTAFEKIEELEKKVDRLERAVEEERRVRMSAIREARRVKFNPRL